MPTIAHLAPSGQFPSYKTFRTFVRFDRLLQGSPPPPDAAAVSKSLSCCWCCEFRTLRSELSPGAGEKGMPRARASAPSGCAPPACPSAAPLPEQPAGGIRLAAGGAASATPISLRGHRCKAASGAARIAAQHAASLPWVAPPPGLLMLAAVRPAAVLRGALWGRSRIWRHAVSGMTAITPGAPT